MDLASIIGIVGCAAAVIYGIISGDQGVAALGNFYDLTSILVTIVGSFMCLLTMADGIPGFISSLKSFTLIFKTTQSNEGEVIHTIIDLANVARKEGLLQLEEAAAEIDDEFLKKGIMLIVDGTDQELVTSILETDLSCIERRHNKNITFWNNLAAMGPAWGMIGTLIGLINMLKLLDDPSSIGPSMAVALITTLYGSLLANWISIPVATKLSAINAREIMVKEVICEGILSIQAGENPRVIEEKLKSFLAPKQRDEILGDNGADQGGEG